MHGTPSSGFRNEVLSSFPIGAGPPQSAERPTFGGTRVEESIRLGLIPSRNMSGFSSGNSKSPRDEGGTFNSRGGTKSSNDSANDGVGGHQRTGSNSGGLSGLHSGLKRNALSGLSLGSGLSNKGSQSNLRSCANSFSGGLHLLAQKRQASAVSAVSAQSRYTAASRDSPNDAQNGCVVPRMGSGLGSVGPSGPGHEWPPVPSR